MGTTGQYHWSQPAITSIIVSVVFTALASIMVLLRVMGRRMKHVSLEADDFTIIASLPCVYLLMAFVIYSVSGGDSGRHIDDIPHDTFVNLLKNLIAIEICWYTSIMLVQMAILLFYLRIFVFQMDRLAAYIMMGVVLCWWFASLLGTFLICKPISYSWNRDQNGSCGSVIELWTATSISHIIIDIMILSLPLPMVWKLQLPFLTKVGLSAIFGLGFFICILGGFRLRALRANDISDLSYTLPAAHTWSMLEPPVSIATACLPVARPLFIKCFPSSFFRTLSRNPPSAKPPVGGLNSDETPRRFQRLDEHELSITEITSVRGDQARQASETRKGLVRAQTPVDSIRVETEWQVMY